MRHKQPREPNGLASPARAAANDAESATLPPTYPATSPLEFALKSTQDFQYTKLALDFFNKKRNRTRSIMHEQ